MEVRVHRLRALGAPSVALAAALSAAWLAPAISSAQERRWFGGDERRFEHVGTFDVRLNGSEAAEIVAISDDANVLVYTDSPGGMIGFVDVRDPARPEPDGTLAVGGEPTSVAVLGPYALVAVNTSASFLEPSGELQVMNEHAQVPVAYRAHLPRSADRPRDGLERGRLRCASDRAVRGRLGATGSLRSSTRWLHRPLVARHRGE